ncbi:type 1 glutamine amidotransferase domain-containing protein [Mucilaginibacter sp.]|jgi:putative intracellular protease/amidase|uniref:type 1 glutamine amidotransferase domain-containing protein n=1 Tax=Mucilaginibacter sp. TaxID=1882438 RepID=UPI003566F580
MKILFIVSSAKIGFWLAELTHPYWHLAERGHEIDIASPEGGRAILDPTSDPYSEGSWEKTDLVSKGFLTDQALKDKISNTIKLKDVDLDSYDALHVVGGGGAAVDLYPNEDVKNVLEHFWAAGKFIGTICHGSIALANIPDKVAGKSATGFSRVEDAQVEALYGLNFIPNFPQPVMEAAGIKYSNKEPWGQHVVIDGKLISGQNQQSASEYAIAYLNLLAGESPVVIV